MSLSEMMNGLMNEKKKNFQTCTCIPLRLSFPSFRHFLLHHFLLHYDFMPILTPVSLPNSLRASPRDSLCLLQAFTSQMTLDVSLLQPSGSLYSMWNVRACLLFAINPTSHQQRSHYHGSTAHPPLYRYSSTTLLVCPFQAGPFHHN